MRREIKFRAWDKDRKCFLPCIAGNTDKNDDNWICPLTYCEVNGVKDWYHNDTCEVMQYTGLKDKNNVEIFEGDIVRYQFDNDDCPFPNKHTEKIIGKVFYSEWRASFSVTAGRKCSKSMNSDLFTYVRNGNRVEVIGNIYETPELIGE